MAVATFMCPFPLQARQEAIAQLVEASHLRSHLQHMLAGIADLERILGRLSLGTVTPRELMALRHSIAKLPDRNRLACMPKSPSHDPGRTVRLPG